MRLARDAFAADEFEVAANLFEIAARDPQNTGAAQLGRAACLSALGRDVEAIAALDAALAAGGVEIAIPIARTLASQGDVFAAMEVLAPYASADAAFARRLGGARELVGLVDHPVFLQMSGRL